MITERTKYELTIGMLGSEATKNSISQIHEISSGAAPDWTNVPTDQFPVAQLTISCRRPLTPLATQLSDGNDP
jgi:hypothetical protein